MWSQCNHNTWWRISLSIDMCLVAPAVDLLYMSEIICPIDTCSRRNNQGWLRALMCKNDCESKTSFACLCIYEHPKVTNELFVWFFSYLSHILLKSHENIIYLADIIVAPLNHILSKYQWTIWPHESDQRAYMSQGPHAIPVWCYSCLKCVSLRADFECTL